MLGQGEDNRVVPREVELELRVDVESIWKADIRDLPTAELMEFNNPLGLICN